MIMILFNKLARRINKSDYSDGEVIYIYNIVYIIYIYIYNINPIVSLYILVHLFYFN